MGFFFSEAHSGAIGAFLVVPFATLASRIKSSPPAMVLKVAAFWALVPGALSFVSLSRAVTGTRRLRRVANHCGGDLLDRVGHARRLRVFDAFDRLMRRRPRARTAASVL